MTSFAPGTNSDYANAYSNWWFNNNGQGPAPQRSAFGADSPVGKAQSIQPQSQGTPYGQPKKSTPFSAYSPQQKGGAFSAYQTPSSFSAGGGMGNYAYSQPNARPQPFVQQTFDFTGRQADPTQLFAQRDAFVQSINNARAPFAMAVGQGTATAPQQLDFQQLWGQAGDMSQGGFSNPFAQQQYSQPRPSQDDAIRNLFTQNNIQAPQGFMDQLLGMLGQQAPPQQLQPQTPTQDAIWSGPAKRFTDQQVAWFESQFPQIPKYEVRPLTNETPYGGGVRNPSEDFVNTGAGSQVVTPWRNQQMAGATPGTAQPIQPPSQGTAYGQPSAFWMPGSFGQQWRDRDDAYVLRQSETYDRYLAQRGQRTSKDGGWQQPVLTRDEYLRARGEYLDEIPIPDSDRAVYKQRAGLPSSAAQQAPQPQLQQPMRQPQLPWMDEMPYGGTPRQPAMPSPWRNPAEDFVDTGAGFQVLQRYRNPQTGETFTAPDSGVQPRPGTGWEPAYGGSQSPRQSPSADQLLNPAYQEWRSQQFVTQVARSPAQSAELEKRMYERFLRETGRAPSQPGTAQPIQPPSQGTAYDPGFEGPLPGPRGVIRAPDDPSNPVRQTPSPAAARQSSIQSYRSNDALMSLSVAELRAKLQQEGASTGDINAALNAKNQLISEDIQRRTAANNEYTRQQTELSRLRSGRYVRNPDGSVVQREFAARPTTEFEWAMQGRIGRNPNEAAARRSEDFAADRALRVKYGIVRGQNTKQEIAEWRKAYDKMTAETAARREAYDKMNPAQKAIADRYGMAGPAHKSVARQDAWGAGARGEAQRFQEMLLLKNYTGDRNPDTSKIPGGTLAAIRDLAAKRAAALSPKEAEAQKSLQQRLGSRNLEARAKAEKELAKMLSGDSQKKKKQR